MTIVKPGFGQKTDADCVWVIRPAFATITHLNIVPTRVYHIVAKNERTGTEINLTGDFLTVESARECIKRSWGNGMYFPK